MDCNQHYLVSNFNQCAYQTCESFITDKKKHVCFIQSGSGGNGTTALMRLVYEHVRLNNNSVNLYAELFLRLLQKQTIEQIFNALSNVSFLFLDDVAFLNNKPSALKVFKQLIEVRKAKRLKTIMTSSSIIPDNLITTELVTAAFATIHKPTQAERLLLLKHFAQLKVLRVSNRSLFAISRADNTSIRLLEGWINRLNAIANLANKKYCSNKFVKQHMSDVLPFFPFVTQNRS